MFLYFFGKLFCLVVYETLRPAQLAKSLNPGHLGEDSPTESKLTFEVRWRCENSPHFMPCDNQTFHSSPFLPLTGWIACIFLRSSCHAMVYWHVGSCKISHPNWSHVEKNQLPLSPVILISQAGYWNNHYCITTTTTATATNSSSRQNHKQLNLIISHPAALPPPRCFRWCHCWHSARRLSSTPSSHPVFESKKRKSYQKLEPETSTNWIGWLSVGWWTKFVF